MEFNKRESALATAKGIAYNGDSGVVVIKYFNEEKYKVLILNELTNRKASVLLKGEKIWESKIS